MPLEAGITIAALDGSWPLGGDPLLQGDDHIRLIKSVLKAQFPGDLGQGFDIPITATEAELNYVSGATSNIQAQIDAAIAADSLRAPLGTVMLFASVAPPVGWVQNVVDNKAMLQLVSDASGGASGGTVDFLDAWAHTHSTGDHILTATQMPSHYHQHGYDSKDVSGTQDPGSTKYGRVGEDRNADHVAWCNSTYKGGVNDASGIDGATELHNHGDTSEVSFVPRYVNVITATKDAT